MEDQPRLSIVQLDKIIAMGMEGARSIRGNFFMFVWKTMNWRGLILGRCLRCQNG